jgi:diacylglycerol kinase family enzyme
MAGVTALARAFGPGRMPLVAPVPGGTVGTVARNWGVQGDPVDCLRWALDHPSAIRPKPTLRIDAAEQPGEPPASRYGFIFGTGLVAQFFELYYERGAPGSAASALIVARVFLESFVGGSFARRVLDPLPCTLRVDGEARPPASWSLVCASVVPNLGIHMLVNYRAGEDPARVHLVASPLPARHLGPRAPFVLAGRRIGGAGHVDELARAFAVEFAERGPYVLDGELLRAERVQVSMGPTVRMVTPS